MDTNRRNTEANEPPRENIVRRTPQNDDLPDSPQDAERLKSDETTIDLPDVNDIPGQEHVRVPAMGELADTTISSDDEEGAGLLDDEAGAGDVNRGI
jgi:hypothetical protein